jgi:flagellin-like hook-associated protein FlgL
MFSWNRSKNQLTNVSTDSTTAGVNIFAKLFGERITFDMGGTYTMVKADDNSADTRQFNATANLNYNLKEYFGKAANPVLSLRNTYLDTRDKVNPSADSSGYGLFLVITMNVPFFL